MDSRQIAINEQADSYISRRNLTNKDIDSVKSDTSIGDELKKKVIEILLAQAEEAVGGILDILFGWLPWNKKKKEIKK